MNHNLVERMHLFTKSVNEALKTIQKGIQSSSAKADAYVITTQVLTANRAKRRKNRKVKRRCLRRY